MNSYNQYNIDMEEDMNMTSPRPSSFNGGIVLVTDATSTTLGDSSKKQEVASVIITTCSGSSYDHLFSSINQQSEYGRIAVYQLTPGRILGVVLQLLQGEDVNRFKEGNSWLTDGDVAALVQLKSDCDQAGADAVCFNFECSSGYNQAGFGSGLDALYMELIAYCVKEYGCLCMFSDFSLMALISKWDTALLGPNPFHQVGNFSDQFKLVFIPEVLKKCSSAQLNTVGNLSVETDGKSSCVVSALGGTIVYTLSKDAMNIAKETKQIDKVEDYKSQRFYEPYEVEVLTVAETIESPTKTIKYITQVKSTKEQAICEILGVEGLAGHVMITFPPSKSSVERFEIVQAELKEAEEKIKDEAEKAGLKKVEDAIEDNILTPARGRILTSCGHWIEIMKIDVNATRLLETVKEEWGGASSAKYQQYAAKNEAWNNMNAEEAEQAVQSEAASYMFSRPVAKFNQKEVQKQKMISKYK